MIFPGSNYEEKLLLIQCACMSMRTGTCGEEQVWMSKNNLQEKVLSFHRAGPGDGTQVSRCGTRHLYLLSHLPDPKVLSE